MQDILLSGSENEMRDVYNELVREKGTAAQLAMKQRMRKSLWEFMDLFCGKWGLCYGNDKYVSGSIHQTLETFVSFHSQ